MLGLRMLVIGLSGCFLFVLGVWVCVVVEEIRMMFVNVILSRCIVKEDWEYGFMIFMIGGLLSLLLWYVGVFDYRDWC